MASKAERNEICFDDFEQAPALAFYPGAPPKQGRRDWLWWTGALGLEQIDDVLGVVGQHSSAVDTIVIGGLDRYPHGVARWPPWLVRWRQRGFAVVVDTQGLTARQRRRLISQTRRESKLRKSINPVVQMAHIGATFRSWRHWLVQKSLLRSGR